jgi:hypothetical protein
MSTQLLERPKVNAKDSTTSAIDDRQFHTITSDDVKRLNELFYRQQLLFPALLFLVSP